MKKLEQALGRFLRRPALSLVRFFVFLISSFPVANMITSSNDMVLLEINRWHAAAPARHWDEEINQSQKNAQLEKKQKQKTKKSHPDHRPALNRVRSLP
jgi:hypothetical protein